MYRNTLDLARQKLLDYIPSRLYKPRWIMGCKEQDEEKWLYNSSWYFSLTILFISFKPFLSPTRARCCHCQMNIAPQRLWQSSRFSVLSPHQSRRRYVLDEIYDYVLRKHWYPLSPFDKIQRMFTFPSGGLSIVFIFNYSKKIGIKWRGAISPAIQGSFLLSDNRLLKPVKIGTE